MRTLVPLLLVICCQIAVAQNDYISPGDKLVTDGIPKIPFSLGREVDPYTMISAYSLAGWDPSKRELWAKSLTSNASLIYRVSAPNSSPQVQTFITTGVYDVYCQPQGNSLVYVKDMEGNEVFQLYAYDLASHKSTLLSDGKSRNTEPVWSNRGDRLIYSSNRRNGSDTDLYILNSLEPNHTRLLAQTEGGYLKVFDWSPDDRQALYYNWISSNESYLYTVDVTTGQKTLLTPKIGNEKVAYDFAQFSRDGKGIYLTTDRDSEFLRLAYMDLATKQISFQSNEIKWNIEDFKLSPDRQTIAFISNEDGIGRLHLLDTATNREKLVPTPGVGLISNLKWHTNSIDLAFVFSSARSVADIYTINTSSGKVERWVKNATDGINVEKFSEAELIHWKSFDSKQISGFLYRPPTKFTGKRPIIINIHGGPDDQARPDFNGTDNYFINELGIAMIYPNVRGSKGYGKTFLKLDNANKREESIQDIGTLLDWIKTQPYLDADRVMVMGASYGGYMSLSAAATYNDRICAALSQSGPTNLVTNIEHTEGWRRDRRREEYGDEREPKMRAFLERIAPLNNVQKIKKPLMIVQGQNDPRVPASEATQMAEAAKKMGTPVWYLLAKDEGHDFANQSTRNFQLYATILFVKEFLLK